jgi:RNA polymerase sigma-70 factor, ECF subfamily
MKRTETILLLPGAHGEGALHARLCAGEEVAFRECYDRYAPRLMRILMKLLRNQATAEEVLQETFLVAFRSVARFRGDSRLSTWLTRIAVNRAYNALRSENRRAKHLLRAPDDAPVVEPRVEDRDLARKAVAILDTMAPTKRLALLLHAHGHSVAEIAEIVAEPRGTILARLSRGRAELSVRMSTAGLRDEAQPKRAEGRS